MKLFIDDWKREPLGYEPTFEGEKYHLVQDRGSGGFRIEQNKREVNPHKPNMTKVT